MKSPKNPSLPLLFRAAAFYAFFSVFFLNAQPFFNSNDPISHFVQRIYNVFAERGTTSVLNNNGGVQPNAVILNPVPPPPPPPQGSVQGRSR